MIIDTKEKWIELAKETIPLLPDYMAEFSGNIDPYKIETELTGLFEKGDWAKLHQRFEQIWGWLPDSPAIRHRPFSDLCDLCSEYWVFLEDEKHG